MDESGLVRTDLGLFLELNAVDASLPSYRRLFLALRRSILSRRIEGGTRLPSTRALSASLGISRNTVKSAYELLQAEGYLLSRRGAGCYVAELPEAKSLAADPVVINQPVKLPTASAINRAPGLLQPAVPALDHFPYRRWQRALQSGVTSVGLLAGDPQGDPRLRREIVRWLGAQRGMQVDPDQVLITSGSQQGIFLVADQLVKAGDRVLLERPGFQGTERVFDAAGARVGHFYQHELETVDRLGPARLLLLTPSRNFPLGHTLAADRRLALLNWARQNRAWLIEDDYDSEFSAGPALSAMFSLDASQQVIYAGTFSRTMFPGLRLGYLVLPVSLVTQFREARRIVDGGLSVTPQMALAEFMACGDYSRHLKRMKRLYLQRRQMLEEMLGQSSLAHLPVIGAGGGMHLCLQVPTGCDDRQLVAELDRVGVCARAISQYDPKQGAGLVLGFAAQDRDAMARGVAILERIVSAALAQLD
ncbi:PLP-dependent aminotransferase family protein [Marinobacterium sp. YM272]|uniref:MocR-like pyridoxine biosynthesis transcription factor PdxR n=1 Tax=Marinobacterium sp. YM272 TaxID=3421654 RepID=UPI003D7FD85C